MTKHEGMIEARMPKKRSILRFDLDSLASYSFGIRHSCFVILIIRHSDFVIFS